MDLVKAATKIFSTSFLGAIISFVGLIYFTRTVSPSDLGVFFLFQALVGVLTIPANLGIRLAVEKRISEGEQGSEYLTSGLFLKIILIVVLSLLLILQEDLIADYLGADLTLPLIVTVSLKELGDLMIAAIRGDLRAGDTAVLNLSYQIGWVSLGALLVALGYELNGLIIATIFGYWAKFAWGLHRNTIAFGRPSMRSAYSLVQFGIYSILPSVEGQVHNWMDTLLLGYFLGPAAVSAYEVAWRVGNAFTILVQAIGETIFAQMSSWGAEGSIDKLERLIPQAITPAVLLTTPAIIGAWFLAEDILSILFSEEYVIASSALIVIVAAKIPRSIRSVTAQGLLGINKADRVTIAAIVDIVLNLFLNITLIPPFGLLGAAVATALSLLGGAIVRWWFLSKEIDVSIDFEMALWAVGGSAVMAIVLSVVLRFVVVTNAITLFGVVAVGALVYLATILLNSDLRFHIQGLLRSNS